MEWSKEIKNIATAVCKAQADFKTVKRTKEVSYGQTHYKYAALEDILDMLRQPLAKNDIALLQFQTVNRQAGNLTVTTKVIHGESGEWIADSTTLPLSQSLTPQTVGAVITYGRRYSLSSLMGIATEDDTDAKDGDVDTPGEKPDAKKQVKPAAKKETKSKSQSKKDDGLAIMAEKRKKELFELMDANTEYVDSKIIAETKEKCEARIQKDHRSAIEWIETVMERLLNNVAKQKADGEQKELY